MITEKIFHLKLHRSQWHKCRITFLMEKLDVQIFGNKDRWTGGGNNKTNLNCNKCWAADEMKKMFYNKFSRVRGVFFSHFYILFLRKKRLDREHLLFLWLLQNALMVLNQVLLQRERERERECVCVCVCVCVERKI